AHCFSDLVVCQQGLDHILLDLTLRSALKEPADEGCPQSADEISRERLPDTGENQKESDEASGKGRDGRRAAVLARRSPNDGPEYPPAVQREAGDQIEQPQDEIQVRQVLGYAEHGLGPGQ